MRKTNTSNVTKKNKRKILSLCLVGAMVLSLSVFSFADTSDVEKNAADKSSVESTDNNQSVNIDASNDENKTFDFEDPHNVTFTGTVLYSNLVDGEGQILMGTEEGQIAIFNINQDTESDVEVSELKEGDELLVGYNVVTSMCRPGSVDAQFVTVVEG